MLVLDRARATEADPDPSTQLELSWLSDHRLVDFDRIQIVNASDLDIEELVIACANDPDPVRGSRYSQVPVHVASAKDLGTNARRLLERTFGDVTYGDAQR